MNYVFCVEVHSIGFHRYSRLFEVFFSLLWNYFLMYTPVNWRVGTKNTIFQDWWVLKCIVGAGRSRSLDFNFVFDLSTRNFESHFKHWIALPQWNGTIRNACTMDKYVYPIAYRQFEFAFILLAFNVCCQRWFQILENWAEFKYSSIWSEMNGQRRKLYLESRIH